MVYCTKVWGGSGTYICNTWAQLDVFFQGAFQPHNDQVCTMMTKENSTVFTKGFSQTFSKLPWARLGYDLFVFHRWSSHNWENREKKVCWWILIPQLFLSKLIFFSQNFLVSGIPQNNTYLLNFQVSGTTTKWKKFSPQPFTSPF